MYIYCEYAKTTCSIRLTARSSSQLEARWYPGNRTSHTTDWDEEEEWNIVLGYGARQHRESDIFGQIDVPSATHEQPAA